MWPGAGHRQEAAEGSKVSPCGLPHPRAPVSPCQAWAGARRVPERVGFLKETGSPPGTEHPAPLVEKKPRKDNPANTTGLLAHSALGQALTPGLTALLGTKVTSVGSGRAQRACAPPCAPH